MYLTIFVAGLTAFIFCSYWVYHYVDLDLDIDVYEEQDRDIPFALSSFEWPDRELNVGGAPSNSSGYPHTFGLPERSLYTRPLLNRKGSV